MVVENKVRIVTDTDGRILCTIFDKQEVTSKTQPQFSKFKIHHYLHFS